MVRLFDVLTLETQKTSITLILQRRKSLLYGYVQQHSQGFEGGCKKMQPFLLAWPPKIAVRVSPEVLKISVWCQQEKVENY